MEQDYLTTQTPGKALLIFALPMITGNLFQQTYTMADSAIVGRFVGEGALAAVGASYALTNIFICVAIGGGVGSSVVVSRYFGAREYRKMKSAVFTALLTFLVVSILLGGIGLVCSEGILQLLKTPPDVLDMAVDYLQIYFLGLPFLFMYNVLSSMFNALGKSRVPLYFLIFYFIFNVVLDVILVTRFSMGVTGVAWATLIAQGISAVMSFFVFLRLIHHLSQEKSSVFQLRELGSMTRIALPSILQQSTVSIGMMLVQSVVNSFGSQALAGFSAGMRIESICVVPMSGIGNALSSYTAQNIGAGKPDRVPEGYRSANRLILLIALGLMLVLEIFHAPLIRLFLGNEGTATAVQTGQDYLTFIGFFFAMVGFKMAVDGILRGAGDMKWFTVANLVNLTLRVTLSVTLAPKVGIGMVWWAVPMGWFVNWAISYRQYRTGHWRQIYQTKKG